VAGCVSTHFAKIIKGRNRKKTCENMKTEAARIARITISEYILLSLDLSFTIKILKKQKRATPDFTGAALTIAT
jgi:hypothetical protein